MLRKNGMYTKRKNNERTILFCVNKPQYVIGGDFVKPTRLIYRIGTFLQRGCLFHVLVNE